MLLVLGVSLRHHRRMTYLNTYDALTVSSFRWRISYRQVWCRLHLHLIVFYISSSSVKQNWNL